MQEDRYTGWHAFFIPALFVCAMWIVFFVEHATGVSLQDLGILPRKAAGLAGILAAPLVHADLNHIASNTLPILVTGTGLFYFYKAIAWRVIGMVYLFTGIWVWMFARDSYHIGASGLIYGFVCFLFFSGMLRRDKRLLAISLLVTFLYGSMVWGILPVDQTVSWESHLFGSVAGIFAAIYFRKEGPTRKLWSWEVEEQMGYEGDGADEAYYEEDWTEGDDERRY